MPCKGKTARGGGGLSLGSSRTYVRFLVCGCPESTTASVLTCCEGGCTRGRGTDGRSCTIMPIDILDRDATLG
jgi:hypothetical protein